MTKTRILVVDDSVVIRRLVSKVLERDESLEIAGTAPNGKIALAKLPQLSPDLVILDIEMPEMDGLETLAKLRKDYPRLPVIMFSTLTRRGASATLDALALGANDYLTKPEGSAGIADSLEAVARELIPRVKSLTGRAPKITLPPPETRPSAPAPTMVAARVPRQTSARIDAVVIGVSTGGPNALAQLVPALPVSLPVPVLIVQHMPATFTQLLAERLDAKSPLRVRECVSGESVQPGTVWIAPGDHHMVVERHGDEVRLATNQDPPENSCRPAVDVLFRSAAAVWGNAALAVVLTGMGSDGTRGCELLREHGAPVLAQDEATSVVWGMPGYVAKAGLADALLPLDGIAPEIARQASRGRCRSLRQGLATVED